MAIYNHEAATQEDNARYLKTVFQRNAEQAWDDKGHPIADQKVLTEQETIKFAKEVLTNWKKLTADENESYI